MSPITASPSSIREDDAIQLSWIMPMYRTADMLEELLRRVRTVAEGLDVRYELILVDDACPQGSAAQARAIAGNDPRVRILETRCNRGGRRPHGDLRRLLDRHHGHLPAGVGAAPRPHGQPREMVPDHGCRSRGSSRSRHGALDQPPSRHRRHFRAPYRQPQPTGPETDFPALSPEYSLGWRTPVGGLSFRAAVTTSCQSNRQSD